MKCCLVGSSRMRQSEFSGAKSQGAISVGS